MKQCLQSVNHEQFPIQMTKDTAVFMFKAAKHIYIFTWDAFGEVNVIKIVNENFVRTLSKNVTLPYMSHIISVINCSL